MRRERRYPKRCRANCDARLIGRPVYPARRARVALRQQGAAGDRRRVHGCPGQVHGLADRLAGPGSPAGRASLPAAINRNEFGNIPRGLIAQLVAVANRERKLSRVKARRIAVSSKVELFYGDPEDQGGRRYPRGIYKRVSLGCGISSSCHRLSGHRSQVQAPLTV